MFTLNHANSCAVRSASLLHHPGYVEYEALSPVIRCYIKVKSFKSASKTNPCSMMLRTSSTNTKNYQWPGFFTGALPRPRRIFHLGGM